jgi:hypothetical protein
MQLWFEPHPGEKERYDCVQDDSRPQQNANKTSSEADVAEANVGVAPAAVCDLGYNAGTTTSQATTAPAYSTGQLVGALPGGCITPTVQGTTYYLCGNTWFSAAYGANEVYYRVVPGPGG